MATIQLSLSSKSNKVTNKHEVLIRFFHGKVNQRAKANVFVHPDYWSDKMQTISIPKFRLMTDENKRIKEELIQSTERLTQICGLVQSSFEQIDSANMPKDWLKNLINGFNFPKVDEQQQEETNNTFFDAFEKYVEVSRFSEGRKRRMMCVIRLLRRLELYTDTTLDFETITDDTLREIEKFYLDEPNICKSKTYAQILKAVPESRTPQPRGVNVLHAFMKCLRAFINWAIDNEYTTNDPFKKYKMPKTIEGDPIPLKKEEVTSLYNFDFSDKPRLARQRDIFVFQCMVGCRVSDLWSATKNSVVNGKFEYIAKKTKNSNGETIRVPLNETAREIIERYKDYEGKQLFQFTAQQRYNDDIKAMLRIAGIDRIVTVLNSKTQEEEKKPICDVASSHTSRRTFIDVTYQKIKDPNIIAKFTGHVENSRAFCRYRNINDEMGKDLVSILDVKK